MALQDTNLLIQAAQLPPTFVGTPNEFLRAIIERMKIVSPSGTTFIFIGDVEPTSNVGPWLKGGTQWFVWDEELKKYVPLDISDSETKWYQMGNTTPSTTTPPVWLKTSQDQTQAKPQPGDPIGWYVYNGTTWVPFTEIQDGQVTTAMLADESVTLDKLASGTQGDLVTFNGAGRPVLLPVGTTGQILTTNGTVVNWSDSGTIFSPTWRIEFKYARTINWVAPAGFTQARVTCVGGGGGGGSAEAFIRGGGGGGAGGSARSVVTLVPGDTYQIKVGAGGGVSNDSPGSAGTSSNFNLTEVIGTGGTGGGAGNNVSGGLGGAGGSGNTGTEVLNGGPGQAANGSPETNGGRGGDGTGEGGNGGGATTIQAGNTPGGGGGGGGNTQAGESGGDGIVIIEL